MAHYKRIKLKIKPERDAFFKSYSSLRRFVQQRYWNEHIIEIWSARNSSKSRRWKIGWFGGGCLSQHWASTLRKRIMAGVMSGASDRNRRPIFEIVPGQSIGPFVLGMTRGQISRICKETRVRADIPVARGGMSFSFDQSDRAVSIEVPAEFSTARLAIAGKEIKSFFNEEVRSLLATIIPLPDDWTKPEEAGIVIFHWEMGDPDVFSFMVFSPGHRFK